MKWTRRQEKEKGKGENTKSTWSPLQKLSPLDGGKHKGGCIGDSKPSSPSPNPLPPGERAFWSGLNNLYIL